MNRKAGTRAAQLGNLKSLYEGDARFCVEGLLIAAPRPR